MGKRPHKETKKEKERVFTRPRVRSWMKGEEGRSLRLGQGRKREMRKTAEVLGMLQQQEGGSPSIEKQGRGYSRPVKAAFGG